MLDEAKRICRIVSAELSAGGEAGAIRAAAPRGVRTSPSGECEACFDGLPCAGAVDAVDGLPCAGAADVVDGALWHVARHRPYCGQSTAERIGAAGFEARALRQEIRRPGRDDVLRALYPGYVFVCFVTHDTRWTRILRVAGVVGILGSSDGTPLPLPPAEAARVMASVDRFGIMRAPKAPPAARPVRGGLEVLAHWLERHGRGKLLRAA